MMLLEHTFSRRINVVIFLIFLWKIIVPPELPGGCSRQMRSFKSRRYAVEKNGSFSQADVEQTTDTNISQAPKLCTWDKSAFE